MALTTYMTTEHFQVMYDPALYPNSVKRAQVLAGMVESEFALLCAWFGVTDPKAFGSANLIQVKAASAPQYGGQEGGYVPAPVPSSKDGMWINLDAQEDDTDDADAAERIKALFVIEMSEILMDYINYRDQTMTWNRIGSNGEGLSLFCGVVRYPQGYYSYQAPSVNAWLQLPNRESTDFVSATEPTDANRISFGCALLFLFYLHSQLYVSESKIIQSGGATLEETYKNIFGRSGGFNEFIQVLRSYFPLGNTPLLSTEDPFPLRPLSFEVRIDRVKGESTPCGASFAVVGSNSTFSAVVSNLTSIYPVEDISYLWDPPAGGHIAPGSYRGESVTITWDTPGTGSATVHVTVTTTTETLTHDAHLYVSVITPIEARLWTAICNFIQLTRFIPQPIQQGDPPFYVFPDKFLVNLEKLIANTAREATTLGQLTTEVMKQRQDGLQQWQHR